MIIITATGNTLKSKNKYSHTQTTLECQNKKTAITV